MDSTVEYEQVYQGICAVAAHCDGALTEDGVGFNGQDTKFGRRIASVPLSEWTDDVKVEAARIANTYQKQIAAYTGIDVTTLHVVQEAKDTETVYAARDDARTYERRAKNADKVAERQVGAVDGKLCISFSKRDPDFQAIKSACQALPNRRFDWDHSCWQADPSEAAEDLILEWDFPLTAAAKALLQAPKPEILNITLAPTGDYVIIDTPYQAELVAAIRDLPGREYKHGSINHAHVHPDVLTLAEQFKLKVHPDARAACEGAVKTLEVLKAAAVVAEDRKTLLNHVSRLQSPEQLPAAFLDLLEGVLAS